MAVGVCDGALNGFSVRLWRPWWLSERNLLGAANEEATVRDRLMQICQSPGLVQKLLGYSTSTIITKPWYCVQDLVATLRRSVGSLVWRNHERTKLCRKDVQGINRRKWLKLQWIRKARGASSLKFIPSTTAMMNHGPEIAGICRRYVVDAVDTQKIANRNLFRISLETFQRLSNKFHFCSHPSVIDNKWSRKFT